MRTAFADLGRREREILETVYRLQGATVAQVRAELAEPPSYSAVRGMLNHLEEKGHLRHEREGLRYVYRPVVGRGEASRRALAHVVRTFFDGSPVSAATALFQLPGAKPSREELAHLSALVRKASGEGR